SIPAASMPFSATPSAGIDQHRQNNEDQIQPIERTVVVHEPRIHDGGYRQEDESEQRQQGSMISALQGGREEENQGEHNSRECEHEDHDEARHTFSVSLQAAAPSGMYRTDRAICPGGNVLPVRIATLTRSHTADSPGFR